MGIWVLMSRESDLVFWRDFGCVAVDFSVRFSKSVMKSLKISQYFGLILILFLDKSFKE